LQSLKSLNEIDVKSVLELLQDLKQDMKWYLLIRNLECWLINKNDKRLLFLDEKEKFGSNYSGTSFQQFMLFYIDHYELYFDAFDYVIHPDDLWDDFYFSGNLSNITIPFNLFSFLREKWQQNQIHCLPTNFTIKDFFDRRNLYIWGKDLWRFLPNQLINEAFLISIYQFPLPKEALNCFIYDDPLSEHLSNKIYAGSEQETKLAIELNEKKLVQYKRKLLPLKGLLQLFILPELSDIVLCFFVAPLKDRIVYKVNE